MPADETVRALLLQRLADHGKPFAHRDARNKFIADFYMENNIVAKPDKDTLTAIIRKIQNGGRVLFVEKDPEWLKLFRRCTAIYGPMDIKVEVEDAPEDVNETSVMARLLQRLDERGRPFDSDQEQKDFLKTFQEKHFLYTRMWVRRISRLMRNIKEGVQVKFVEKDPQLVELYSRCLNIYGPQEPGKVKDRRMRATSDQNPLVLLVKCLNERGRPFTDETEKHQFLKDFNKRNNVNVAVCHEQILAFMRKLQEGVRVPFVEKDPKLLNIFRRCKRIYGPKAPPNVRDRRDETIDQSVLILLLQRLNDRGRPFPDERKKFEFLKAFCKENTAEPKMWYERICAFMRKIQKSQRVKFVRDDRHLLKLYRNCVHIYGLQANDVIQLASDEDEEEEEPKGDNHKELIAMKDDLIRERIRLSQAISSLEKRKTELQRMISLIDDLIKK